MTTDPKTDVRDELLEAVSLAVLDLIDVQAGEHPTLQNSTANNLRDLIMQLQKLMA